MNVFKQKSELCKPAMGFWLSFPSPELVEFMGYAGFDFMFIDAEHFVFNLQTIQSLVRSAELVGITPIIRVPKNDQELILGYLETGAAGILVPHINTVEEAQAAVLAIKYPPLGARGAGSSTRAAHYGLPQSSADYFKLANKNSIFLAMIEEVEGFNNLDEILRVEGLDSVFLGAGDLSLSMGFPGQPNHPEVKSLIDFAKKQIIASGKPLGALGATIEAAQIAIREGVDYFALSLNGYIGQQLSKYLSDAKKT